MLYYRIRNTDLTAVFYHNEIYCADKVASSVKMATSDRGCEGLAALIHSECGHNMKRLWEIVEPRGQ